MSRTAPRANASKFDVRMAARPQTVAAGLSLLCLALVPCGAAAGELRGPPDDVIMLAGALPDSELDTYRGGFNVGGFMVNFGLEVATLFEGKQLISRMNVGGQAIGGRVQGSFTSTLTDTATGQSVTLTGADQNSRVVQAITGNAQVTVDYTNGVATIIKNRSDNATVNNRVTMTVGLDNYKGMLQNLQIRRVAAGAVSNINYNRRR